MDGFLLYPHRWCCRKNMNEAILDRVPHPQGSSVCYCQVMLRDMLEVTHQVEQFRNPELAEGRGMDGLETSEPSADVSTFQSTGRKHEYLETQCCLAWASTGLSGGCDVKLSTKYGKGRGHVSKHCLNKTMLGEGGPLNKTVSEEESPHRRPCVWQESNKQTTNLTDLQRVSWEERWPAGSRGLRRGRSLRDAELSSS